VSLPLGPVLMPLFLVAVYLLLAPDGWAVLLAGLGTLAYLALAGAPPETIVGAALLFGLVAGRYRDDLATMPHRRGRAAPPR
jgi:hypothetical protein